MNKVVQELFESMHKDCIYCSRTSQQNYDLEQKNNICWKRNRELEEELQSTRQTVEEWMNDYRMEMAAAKAQVLELESQLKSSCFARWLLVICKRRIETLFAK